MNKSVYWLALISLQLNCVAWAQTTNAISQQIKSIRESIDLSPLDVSKRLRLARLLKQSGQTRQAAIEDLNATAVDPSTCIAYHEMLQNKASVDQINECVARLTKYDQLQPNQLSVRMTLSELYEEKGDYYQAARVLVDLQYVKGAIPTKFAELIDERIHGLLNDSKDAQTTEKAIEQKKILCRLSQLQLHLCPYQM